jgi:hypothetical protein
VEISFVTGPDGLVVPGSEHVQYSHRTGNTHLPDFVLDAFDTIAAEYDIPEPDLSFVLEDLRLHDGAARGVWPEDTGVLPGRAYTPGGRAPTITDGGSCVAGLYVSGGSIGYRPMLGADGPSDEASAWAAAVQDAPDVPNAVGDPAGEIYNMFFKDGATGSTFVQAPPIWQEINVKACAGGQIGMNNGEPIFRASHMPDQYLYHNDQAIDLAGATRATNEPVMHGEFKAFSNVADQIRPHPFGWCYYGSGRSGNPWQITVSLAPTQPGINPDVVLFCDGSTPTRSSAAEHDDHQPGVWTAPMMLVLLGAGCVGLVWLLPGCVWFRNRRVRLPIHLVHVLASVALAVALIARYPTATGLWVLILGPGGLVASVRFILGILGVTVRLRIGDR